MIAINDKVKFIHPNFKVYNKEGEDVYRYLKEDTKYIVEEVLILTIKLQGIKGYYLKENFRKLW